MVLEFQRDRLSWSGTYDGISWFGSVFGLICGLMILDLIDLVLASSLVAGGWWQVRDVIWHTTYDYSYK